MKSVMRLVVVAPIAVFLIAFALINRHDVTVAVDPLAANPAESYHYTLPLYVLMFSCIGLGVLCGGVVTWAGQSRHRRSARQGRAAAETARQETERLRVEAAKLTPVALAGQRELPGLKLKNDAI